MSPTLCATCYAADATKACDYLLGWPLTEHRTPSGQPVRSFSDLPYQCDAPLCDRCAVVVGRIHFSGEDGGTDTTDWCPHHPTPEPEGVFLTPEQADQLRAQAQLRPLPSPLVRALEAFATADLEAEVARRKVGAP